MDNPVLRIIFEKDIINAERLSKANNKCNSSILENKLVKTKRSE